MSIYQNFNTDDLTDEEKKLLADAENAQGGASATGSAIGTAAGAIGGGLLGNLIAPGAGVIPGASLGSGLGGTIGGWLGSLIGGAQAEDAAKKYEELRKKRVEPMIESQARLQAVQELLGRWTPEL